MGMAAPPLTALEGQQALANLRPSVSARIDLARARGKARSGSLLPSLMPSTLKTTNNIYVGNVGHAKDLKQLGQLGIVAVINCAPSVCKTPVKGYSKAGILR